MVAEICLIGVLLVSAVLISGVIYGAFSFYYSPPQVAVEATTCSSAGGSEICQFVLMNLGARMVGTDGACSITLGGSFVQGTIMNGGTVPANGALDGVSCVVQGSTANAGSRLAGSIALTNGALAYFTAMAS